MPNIQKSLRFPPQVITILEKKATKLGLSFNEYVVFKMTEIAEKEMNEQKQRKILLLKKNSKK